MKVVSRLLTKRGHVVVEAEDGLQALDKYEQSLCEQRFFDGVFMDFVMPRMNGPQAAHELRSRGFKQPIIGVTGNVLSQDVDCFLAQGANSVLSKPLQVVDLDAALRSM